jgi:uncharacterized protein
MGTRKAILRRLKNLKDDIKKRFKVQEIGIFGSAARDELKNSSDIDLLVNFEETADLFDLVAMGEFLERQLKRKVDIVTPHALRKEFKERVQKELLSV